jgi:hypothetical protein
VCGGGTSLVGGEKEIKVTVHGLHIPIRNRTKKPLAIKWGGKRAEGRDDGGNVTNVQYKSNWNRH